MRECRCYDLSAEDLGSFQGVFIPDLKNEPEKKSRTYRDINSLTVIQKKTY